MTRVLVVDDDPQLLRALRINLSVRGYEVITAPTGSRALALAAEHPPQVVILDLGMPDISGIEVLAGLRGWLTAPVIVLSARTDSSDKVGALDAGADDYMTKPFGMDELLARLRAAVRRAAVATGADNPVVETKSFLVDLSAKSHQERRGGPPDPDRMGHAGNAGAQSRQAGRPGRVAQRGMGTQVRQGNSLSACLSRAVATQARGRSIASRPSADRGGNGLSLRGLIRCARTGSPCSPIAPRRVVLAASKIRRCRRVQ
jgi:CheY-like chemotaxis protein